MGLFYLFDFRSQLFNIWFYWHFHWWILWRFMYRSNSDFVAPCFFGIQYSTTVLWPLHRYVIIAYFGQTYQKKKLIIYFLQFEKKNPLLFPALPATLSPLSLSCLVQIASVRRSLFNNSERGKFLNQLVAGVRDILQNPSGLTDPNNYHEFCRLLARLKSNYQLGELVMVDQYPESIQVICFWVFLHHVKNHLLH